MIRKSATGVIVALAVIWGGGTWYTGTQIGDAANLLI